MTWRSFILLVCLIAGFASLGGFVNAAFGQDLKSVDFRSADPELGLAREPRYHVMVTGNATYDNLQAYGLPGVESDKAEIRDLFANVLSYDEINDDSDEEIASYKDFFTRQLPAAAALIEDGDIFVFYYSGHGFSYRGENYIVPKQFPRNADMMLGNAVKVWDIVRMISRLSNPGAIIVIVDACRTDVELDVSVSASMDGKSFEARTVTKPATPTRVEDVLPKAEANVTIWYPSGDQFTAASYDTAPSPFTQAFSEAVRALIGGKRWSAHSSVGILRNAIQKAYEQQPLDTYIEPFAVPWRTSTELTSTPALRLSDTELTEADQQWQDSLQVAKVESCLEAVGDFVKNYPWSRMRPVAVDLLRTWFPVFKSIRCKQTSQLVMASCAIGRIFGDSTLQTAGRIVSAPKRFPVSAPGLIDCGDPTDISMLGIDEGLLATGPSLEEARESLLVAQSRIAMTNQRSFDSLAMQTEGDRFIPDTNLEFFEDQALSKRIQAGDMMFSGPPIREYDASAQVVAKLELQVQESETFRADELRDLYSVGLKYKLNETATIRLPGVDNTVYARLPGNSDTKPVDLGQLLGERDFKAPDNADEVEALVSAVSLFLASSAAKAQRIFYVNLSMSETEAGEASLYVNRIKSLLYGEYDLHPNQVAMSRRLASDSEGAHYQVSVFGK